MTYLSVGKKYITKPFSNSPWGSQMWLQRHIVKANRSEEIILQILWELTNSQPTSF